MQYISEKIHRNSKSATSFREQEIFIVFFSLVIFLFTLMTPFDAYGATKKPKIAPKPKTAVSEKRILVNDSNILVHQKRVEDLVEKGDFKNAVKIMLKMNDYAKEVLSVTKAIKFQYETFIDNPQTSQNDKEDLFFKINGLDRLISRYTTYYEASTFNLGYIYAKLQDTEKARKYLVEFLQIVAYSGDPDSQWSKAKILLLEQYSLKGEF